MQISHHVSFIKDKVNFSHARAKPIIEKESGEKIANYWMSIINLK